MRNFWWNSCQPWIEVQRAFPCCLFYIAVNSGSSFSQSLLSFFQHHVSAKLYGRHACVPLGKQSLVLLRTAFIWGKVRPTSPPKGAPGCWTWFEEVLVLGEDLIYLNALREWDILILEPLIDCLALQLLKLEEVELLLQVLLVLFSIHPSGPSSSASYSHSSDFWQSFLPNSRLILSFLFFSNSYICCYWAVRGIYL
jgi:hypothetical protein